MELNYYSTPESLDWSSIAKANLYSYQDLQQIKDDFPDIRAHFPILEMSCLGKEQVNWSNFYIKEFVGTIDRLEDNLNSLEDLLIKNIVWIRDQPISTGSVNDLDDQLINLYKLTLLVRVAELYREHLNRECCCHIGRYKFINYLSCGLWGATFIAGSVDSIVQEATEDSSQTTFTNTILWFASGTFSAFALWIQKIESKHKRMLDSLSRVIMIKNTIKTLYSRIIVAKEGLEGIQNKIDLNHLVIVGKHIPTMPTWFERLYGTYQLLVEKEELSPFAKLELETILFEQIRDKLDLLTKLHENIPSTQVDQLLSFFHKKKVSSACTFEDPNDV